jgi:glycerophosphoryl diester phosphodiesterase
MRLLSSQSGRVLTIVHRGALEPAHANSLTGVRESIAAGVDGIEIDVQVTRDGHVVLFHDPTVAVEGRRRPVGELTLVELSHAATAAGLPEVARLRDVLDELRETPALVVLDIKSPTTIDYVVRLVRETHATDRVMIASFDFFPLLRTKRVDTALPTLTTVGVSRVMRGPVGLLWGLFALLFPVSAAFCIRANALLCPGYRLSRRLVWCAHRMGIAVFAWKLEGRPQRWVAAYDVDGMIVDPPLVTHPLDERRPQLGRWQRPSEAS